LPSRPGESAIAGENAGGKHESDSRTKSARQMFPKQRTKPQVKE